MPVTDEQRIEVCRELWAYWYRTKSLHLDQAMANYQREAQERAAAAGQKEPAA